MKKLIKLFFFCSFSFLPLLQASTIEDLSQQLNEDLSSVERIDILLQLSKMVQRNNPNQGFEYAFEAKKLAQKEKDIEREARSLVEMSYAKMYVGEKTKSLQMADHASLIAKANGYEYLIAKLNHIKGLDFYMMGMDEASLKCYHKALEINQRLGLEEESIRQINNIALVYREIKDYDQALKYLEKCHDLSIKLGMDDIKAYSRINAAYIYLAQEKYKKGISYVEETIEASSISFDTLSLAIFYNIYGLLQNGIGHKDEALINVKKSIKFAKQMAFSDGEIHAMESMSKILMSQKRPLEAMTIAKEALKQSDLAKTRRYSEGLLQTLITANKELGQEREALRYQDRLLVFKDSMYNIEKSKLVDHLDLEYLTREKELENQQLRFKQEKDAEVIALQRYITVLALFIGILFIGLSILLFRSLKVKRTYSQKLESAIKERTKELEYKNKELIISNQELERFAYVASHDLKEPLRNITSFANLLDRKVITSERKELKEYAGYIVRGTKQLYAVIESILKFSEVKQGANIPVEKIDLNQLMRMVKDHLALQIKEKNAQVIFDQLPIVKGNKDHFFVLFKNLIENGIKYNKNDVPQINIDFEKEEDSYLFSIQDNGIGVQEKYAEEIFEMFKRLHNRAEYQGSGMGLSICKKIVSSLNGRIWVESKATEGSTFFIRFPQNQIEIEFEPKLTEADISTS